MCMYLCTFSCYGDAESSGLPFVAYFAYLLKDSIDGCVLCACFLGYSIDGCVLYCVAMVMLNNCLLFVLNTQLCD